jgi:uncharacterized membrane protein (UPF0127 family)
MTRRLRRLAAALLLAAAPACTPADPPHEAWVAVRGERIGVEIADTWEEQRRGLGGRDALGWDEGMYFLYREPAFLAFWMKGMRFDIDIVWIRDGRIVDVTERAPHDVPEPLPFYRPAEMADAVLEVPAGAARARGWRIGDRVELHRSEEP